MMAECHGGAAGHPGVSAFGRAEPGSRMILKLG